MTSLESTPLSSSSSPPCPGLNESIESLVELAHQCTSAKAFLRDALGLIATTIHAPYALAEIRLRSHMIEEVYAAQEEQRAFWQKTAHGVMTKAVGERAPRARLYQAKKSSIGLGIFSVPVYAMGGRCSGAMVLVAPCETRQQAEDILVALGAMASLLSMLLGDLGDGAKQGSPETDLGAISNLRKGVQFTTPTELAFALTNKLRTRDGSDLVAMACIKGNKVQMLSISGLDDISGKSPGVRVIQAAMEECRDLGMPVVSQRADHMSDENWATGGRLHQAWSHSQGGAAVASLPLHAMGQVVAVLSIQRSPRMGFKPEDIQEYRGLVEPYVETLAVIERASRTLWEHFLGSARVLRTELLAPGSWGVKLKLALPILGLLWLLLGSMDHAISVPCEVVPIASQHIGVPVDGLLTSVSVRPGDRVALGDELCRFDTAALELELSQLGSRLSILSLEERTAVASGEPVDVQLARANQEEVQANIKLIEHRIESCIVRAPADGTIVTGDLDQRLGDVFRKGDGLFTMASLEGWQLELEIPERDISYVRVGIGGRFASMARPEEARNFTISRVSPSALHSGTSNIFVAKADAELPDDWVRSGMGGLANIKLQERAPWWVLSHRAGDWLSLNLWL